MDGAFFDDFDGAVCPFESAFDQLPAHYTLADRLAMHASKMKTMGAVAERLCAAGQRAVFAMAASFSIDVAPPEYRCEVNESTSVALIGPSVPFARCVQRKAWGCAIFCARLYIKMSRRAIMVTDRTISFLGRHTTFRNPINKPTQSASK